MYDRGALTAGRYALQRAMQQSIEREKPPTKRLIIRPVVPDRERHYF